MTTIGAYDAKTHLPSLLDRVAKGESITITKRGRPVAVLVPPTAEVVDARAAARGLIAFRRKHRRRLRGLTARELIAEGRR
ncbi:MAG TPA: type II toxin-antitoxin system prevent-host-death family antitoxin [Chloroflexota bacterium]|nr:type II toxin-antitoxin system prevent-host-death family antitoxin [Chloroflexota bacterium]